MWGVYLKPFSLKRRASKHFSLRWKASSRSSCHISSFLAKLTSTISRWGVYVKDFFLSPISLFHSYTPLPHPTPTSVFLSSSANMSLPRSPPLLLTLYNSLSVSLKMFQSPYHSFQSLLFFSPIAFSQTPSFQTVCARVHTCVCLQVDSFTFKSLHLLWVLSRCHISNLKRKDKNDWPSWTCMLWVLLKCSAYIHSSSDDHSLCVKKIYEGTTKYCMC